jgi:hypothetical protein
MTNVTIQTGRMHFSGRLSADAPDPALDTLAKARRMPVPVYGLTPQRHVEDWDAFGVQSATHDGELDSCTVSVSYTLWRNPHNIHDPVNLARLDDETRRSLDSEVPWARPEWLLERVRRMHYPMLWECVRTSWHREPEPRDSIESELVSHVNYILVNSFRATRVDPASVHGFDGLSGAVHEKCVEHGVVVRVDGFERSGIRIDTDPDVYGVGVALGGSLLTAVVPRDELRFIELSFETRRL